MNSFLQILPVFVNAIFLRKAMKAIKPFIVLFSLIVAVAAQDNLPIIKSNVGVISIQDGENLRKDWWRLAPETKPDVYKTAVPKGKKKTVTFITDVDKISFEVEAGKKYNFIVQKGEAMCYTQINANELHFWNDSSFWESPTMKTPYKWNLSDEEKIAGLSKFWSEAKYNFINFHLVPDLDWDQTYLEFIPRVLATKSTLEYYKVLQMFCARLKDGHTNVWGPSELDNELFARPAIVTRLVEDRVVTIGVADEKLKNQGLAVGQEIIEISGVPVKKYAEDKVLPYLSESTPQATEMSLYQNMLLAGPSTQPVDLTLKDLKGNLFKKRLSRLPIPELNKLAAKRLPFEMTMLTGNIALVKVNTMMDQEKADQLFADNFAHISKADALILDLRENGGGNSGIGYRILSFLVDKPFKQSKWMTREYHPTFRPWGRQENAYGDANAYEHSLNSIKKMRGENTVPFLKPVIVLSSPRTGSAAEDFLVAFKPLNRGLIIGEPSNGSTGQPLVISLPGGGSARICSKYDSFPDGTQFVGVGVIPDVLARPKISDFLEGKDSVLEAALRELKKR